MEEIFEKFIYYLKVDKKMSDNTINSYKRDLQFFIVYLDNQKIDAQIVSSYLEQLKKHAKSSATISRTIASLRSFFRYLINQSLLEQDPSEGIKYEKATLPNPSSNEILTIDEIDRLILATKKADCKGYRDCAIIETMYSCGLKVTELLDIKTSDLNLPGNFIIINSNDQMRYAPLYKGAKQALTLYLKKSRVNLCHNKKNKILFLNKDGFQLTRQGLWKILKEYAIKASIQKKITPHLIRKSMAIHMVENGIKTEDLQNILGLKNIAQTKEYIRNFKPNIVDIYKKVHPKG